LAVDYATAALALSQSEWWVYDAYLKRGASYAVLRQHSKAIPDIDAAIRLEPGEGFMYSMRSRYHAALGHDQQAQSDRDTACRFTSTSCY